jgi:hypothetical protein
MGGITLESAEFAFLLATVHASSVVGIEDPAIFPADQASRDAVYAAGIRSMIEHGWLKPAPGPSQFHFNATLFQMAAVIASPDIVVFTARTSDSFGRQAIAHYLAGSDIVELIATVDGKYHLGIIPDRVTLCGRMRSELGLQDAKPPLRIQFLTEESVFQRITDSARKGSRAQAAAILQSLGLGGLSVDSLLAALAAKEERELSVVKVENGQAETGRRARLFRGKDIVWLVKRQDAASAKISVETMQTETLPDLFDSFVQSLSQ